MNINFLEFLQFERSQNFHEEEVSHSNSVLVITGITSHGWLLIPIMTKSAMVKMSQVFL
jgi:hypothetical protein